MYSLKKALKAEIGYFENEVMHRAGEEWAQTLFADWNQANVRAGPRAAIESMLQECSEAGFGNFALESLDPDGRRVEISSADTLEGKWYMATEGLQKECVCSHASGIVAEICRRGLDVPNSGHADIDAVELECIAQGAKRCQFLVATVGELDRLGYKSVALRETISEHTLRLNEEILIRNLELQNLNLNLERLVRKRTEELRRSEENYRSLVNLSPYPILLLDTKGNITTINEAGVRMLGFGSAEDMKSLGFVSLVEGGEITWDKLSWLLEKQGTVSEIELELLRRDGGCITVEVSARFADLNTGRHVEAVIRDITERKALEKQILDAKTEAEFLNDLLSHDIVNQTMVSLQFLENLAQSPHLTEGDRKGLRIGLKNVRAVLDLAVSVRDLSRIKATGDRELELRDLVTVIGQAIEETKKMLFDKNVAFNFERPQGVCRVKGHSLLPRLFTNLLSNGVKFSRGEIPEVDVLVDEVTERDTAYCRVKVVDRGVGIPDDEKEKVFRRVHRHDPSGPGTGQGLFLVRSIAEACGGRVWAENTVPGDYTKGTTMVVLLEKVTLGESGRTPAMSPLAPF